MPRRSAPTSHAAPRPEVLAFLQAIKENPDDDGPRLMLADWLQEQGDPRGEFVRLQVEFERLPLGDKRRTKLEALADRLESRHGWLARFLTSECEATCSRGLVHLSVGVHRLHEVSTHAGPEAWAWVEQLTLSGFDLSSLWGVTSYPAIASVSSLTLHADRRVRRDDIVPLALSPHLSQLVTLQIDARCGPHFLGLLASAWASKPRKNYTPRLQTLNLEDAGIPSEAIEALGRVPGLRQIRSLNLSSNRLWGDRIQDLVRSLQLSQVVTLDMSATAIECAGTFALANWSSLEKVVHLDLADASIGPEGAAALAASRYLRSLAYLDLAYNVIKDEGAVALAGSRALANLRVLELSRTGIGDAGAIALAGSPHLGRLESLRLLGTDVSDEGILALANSPQLGALKDLQVPNRRFCGKAAAAALRRRFGK